ncbi:hypothetical protein [Maricaulis sp.]|uniref:hypothetical protein n=1 Tax=Maricaulis sp. TaxID=1486257 RepID=UPI0025C51AE6|nr:hypothetical protein [Maricaulis sp.]
MKCMKAIATPMAAMAALSLWSASAHAREQGDTSLVHRACIAAGQNASVCACILREAHSRFSHDQLDLVGAAMPWLERITEDRAVAETLSPDRRLSAEQLQQLRQRAEAADVVIRQACGVGLRLGKTS